MTDRTDLNPHLAHAADSTWLRRAPGSRDTICYGFDAVIMFSIYYEVLSWWKLTPVVFRRGAFGRHVGLDKVELP